MKQIFDLPNTKNESQIKGEQQLKCLTELVEFISTKYYEYETDRKKKDEMINSLEKKALENGQLTNGHPYLTDKEYCRRNCILIQGVRENLNEGTGE